MTSPAVHVTSPEIEEIRGMATRLVDRSDLDPLLDRIGDARYVLLGEASHGTADYYRWRAAITERLIVEHGFSFVAVEGDWPDCYTINRWVKGREAPAADATAVLARFERWPTWMWANEEVAVFIDWLRDYNRSSGRAVGFYGLDVYSLWDSLRIVHGYLREHQPDALGAALDAYRCFEPYEEDPQRYAWATRCGLTLEELAVCKTRSQARRRNESLKQLRFTTLAGHSARSARSTASGVRAWATDRGVQGSL